MNRLIIVSFCFAMVSYSYSRNYYVKTDGNDALTATSWGWASSNLQNVINKAVAGDVIYVAAGTYYGGFTMKEGVSVFGSYTANADNPTERYMLDDTDINHYSILDGQKKQRVLTQIVPFSIPTIWDGFIIQNGKPDAVFKVGSIVYSQNSDELIGVLYHFTPETKKGKMIGVPEISKHWGGYETVIPDLKPLINAESAKNDISGDKNSAQIIAGLLENSIDFSTIEVSNNGNYAAFWCDTLTTGGYTNWYLPAPGEFKEISDANIQAVLTNVGKNLQYPYWTSGQIGNTLSWVYSFGGAYFHPALKYVAYTVSAIHEFDEPEVPSGIYVAGGGAFLSANGVLQNCKVIHNTSASKGGGVYVGVDGELINCIVEENDAPEGKEIYYEVTSGIQKTVSSLLDFYPNPVRSGTEIQVRLSNVDQYNYVIFDVSGQIITSGTVGENKKIAIPAQKGIYIINLNSDKIALSKKLIIN